MWRYVEDKGRAFNSDTCYGLYTVPTWNGKYAVVLKPVFCEDVSKCVVQGTFDNKESAKACVKELVEKFNEEKNLND